MEKLQRVLRGQDDEEQGLTAQVLDASTPHEGGPAQAPPPGRPFRSRRGGVCAAAGIGSDAATLSCAF
ncbi:hypothetical protein R6Z07F_016889 [Ovis aries]